LRSGAKPIDDAAVRSAAEKREWGHPEAPAIPNDAAIQQGAKVFEGRCVMCHRRGGATIPLALQSSVQAPDASSVAQAIANGIMPPTGALGRSMPAFKDQLTEADTVALVKFVRSRFGKDGAWSGVESAVKSARSGH
jgi:mono/diheme cytochrome c family protein